MIVHLSLVAHSLLMNLSRYHNGTENRIDVELIVCATLFVNRLRLQFITIIESGWIEPFSLEEIFTQLFSSFEFDKYKFIHSNRTDNCLVLDFDFFTVALF